ncbi:MAG: hypothetical protein R3E60_00455 [Alphaproteobacteria bacterium]
MESQKVPHRRLIDPMLLLKIFIGILIGGGLVLWGAWSLIVSALKIILPTTTP